MGNPATKVQPESGFDLREMTEARVRLGRFGAGIPTKASLAFLLDHARAREAVWSPMNGVEVQRQLTELGLDVLSVESLAGDRGQYVRRPDLGRRLSAASAGWLESVAEQSEGFDVVITVADGLSSSAVDINAVAAVKAIVHRLRGLGFSLAPIILASQARVALSDPIGEALGAGIAIMLIGERPGLSAADSLGAYVTYSPQTGTPDSRRNCVSNIREGGLSAELAAEGIVDLVVAMAKTGLSGVGLKDAMMKLEACREGGGYRLPTT